MLVIIMILLALVLSAAFSGLNRDRADPELDAEELAAADRRITEIEEEARREGR